MRLLREGVIHGDAFDMTMTMVRMKQYEACERRLSAYPSVALFSKEATDRDAQALLMCSYDNASELSKRRLLNIGELRAAVLARLPLETQFLDVCERYLLMVLLHEGGTAIVEDPVHFGAVESLVKRLWCSARPTGDGWQLTLPDALKEPLEQGYQHWMGSASKRRLYYFNDVVTSLLYTAGLVDEKRPMELFLSQIIQRDDWMARDIARRYMKTQFDYITDANGQLILVHPALVDPERMLALQRPDGVLAPEVELSQLQIAADLLSASLEQWTDSQEYEHQLDIMQSEIPLHSQMTLLLMDAVRPDYDPDGCAEDLRLLIKQDYAFDYVLEALKAMLSQRHTPEMETTLRDMYLNIPRWAQLKAARVQ